MYPSCVGHAFAGGAVLAFSHDFRVMQSEQGWISLPEIFLNISFPPGINEILKYTKLLILMRML
jgi:enoyl-CoA hydratase/carnithine racemase